MAKLSKSEVAAVANKLHTELFKINKEREQRLIANYVPSDDFKELQELLDIRDTLSELQAQTYGELDYIKKLISDKLFSVGTYARSTDSQETILNSIRKKECPIPALPTIDELKDEVTIAAIDEDFNTAAFIKEQTSKFI